MAVTRRIGEVSSPIFNQVTDLSKKIASNSEIDTVAFRALGVHPTDINAQRIMKEKLVQVLQPDTEFRPLESNPGVYFVYKKTEQLARDLLLKAPQDHKAEEKKPIAVLKIGEQRANIELAAREIAHLLGLGDYVVPGVFFGAQNLENVWEDDFAVALWNGGTKTYLSESEVESESEETFLNSAYFGILEAYVNVEETSISKKDKFVMILLTALAIGLRDGRAENMTPIIIDAEECMPERIEAPEHLDRACAATHLPFIENHKEFLDQPVSADFVVKMKQIVSQWDIDKITEEVRGKKILFPDSACEHSTNIEMKDAGQCLVRIDLDEKSDIKDHLYTPKTSVNLETSIFDKKQIETLGVRLQRLKNLIEEQSTFSPYQLIETVDKEYTTAFAVAEEIYRRSADLDLGRSTREYSVEQRSESVGRKSIPLVRGDSSVEVVAQNELDRIREELERVSRERDEAFDAIMRLKDEMDALRQTNSRERLVSESRQSPVDIGLEPKRQIQSAQVRRFSRVNGASADSLIKLKSGLEALKRQQSSSSSDSDSNSDSETLTQAKVITKKPVLVLNAATSARSQGLQRQQSSSSSESDSSSSSESDSSSSSESDSSSSSESDSSSSSVKSTSVKELLQKPPTPIAIPANRFFLNINSDSESE